MKKRIQNFIIILAFAFTILVPLNLPIPIGNSIQTVLAAETYSEWNLSTIYNTGDIVSYNGKLWMAQWWTQGQAPGTTGEWGVWKLYSNNGGSDTDPEDNKIIALTFDDGPSITTNLVLDKLQKYNVPASFFLIGANVTDDKKSIIEREINQGCEINNHSWSHSDMSKMPGAEISDEIQKTNDVIYKMVGVQPKFFRPPYISVSNGMYDSINIPFICGIGCNDWETSVSAEDRAKIILNNAKDGDIVLLHDFYGNTQTVDALDSIITGLQDNGFKFVTVSQLFEQKGVDANVEYKLWTNVTN